MRRTSPSTAQPVAWQPPLCWRTRCHYSDRHLLSSLPPLFLSSSVFPWCPSPCPPHYKMAFDYYDTSALCLACWHSRTPFGLGGVRVPCLSPYEVVAVRSCLLYAGRTLRAFQIPVGRTWTVAVPFWSECFNQFHALKVSTLQTKVPRVSIDHRVSPSFPLTGLVGQGPRASHPERCHLPTHAA